MQPPELAITICATKHYTYAMRAQARRVSANLAACPVDGVVIVLVGDGSPELLDIVDYYRAITPSARVDLVTLPDISDDSENYKQKAQLLIARMRTEAFTHARALGVRQCWSLDSDTLPPANALRCMRDSLAFDGGFYSIASCPYPNDLFLGGFGTHRNQIAEDYLPTERKLTPQIRAEWEANEAELRELNDSKKPVTDEHRKRWEVTNKKVKECPPDGSIWDVTAKHGWRRRGWLDHAYPAIGLGAFVPVDWCGFGCTLMNSTALLYACFDGYEGHGTEDLYVCWRHWHPAGLRINAIPHCPCDHVIWGKKKNSDPNTYTLIQSYHEPEGEYRGHLRTRRIPWQAEFRQPLPANPVSP